MAFDIFDNLDKLPSREIRTIITGVSHGVRLIDDYLIETEDSTTEEGGLIPGIINGFLRYAGMLFGKISQVAGKFLKWSLSSIWGLVVSGAQTLWNFNWNISDEELKAQIDAANVALAGTFGETLGILAGQVVCGVLPGAVLLKFNQALGVYTLKNAGIEILDELAANLGTLATLAGQQAARIAFSFLFRKIRDTFFPNRQESEPWSFALAWEKFEETIEEEALRDFISSLREGLAEGCSDIGYVIWGGVDQWLVESRLQPSPLGTEGLIELQLNKSVSNDDSSIRNRQLIYGPSALLGHEAVNRIEADRQLQQVRQFQQTQDERPTYRQKGLICIIYSRLNALPGESFNETQISFRTKEDIARLTPSITRIYAQRVRDEFFKPPLIFKKGKFAAKYQDRLNGISDRRYMVLNETEGRKIISALARSATGQAPKWEQSNLSRNLDPAEAYDQTPPNEIIAGEIYPGVVRGAEIDLVPRSCKLVCGSRATYTLIDATGKLPWDLHTIEI